MFVKANISIFFIIFNENDSNDKIDSHFIDPSLSLCLVISNVDTDMQLKIRSANKETFSLVENFKDYHSNGDLETPDNVAKKILYVIENQDIFESNELTLRDITI